MNVNKPFAILLSLLALYGIWHFGRWYENRQPDAHVAAQEPLQPLVIHEVVYLYADVEKPVETVVERVEYVPAETQAIEFTITAYCAENYPHICNNGDATTTATGTTPTPGRTIAVDPKIIPYGSKVYIEGIGVFIAEDTFGSRDKGNCIDLLMATHYEALEFGRQKLKVWVLGD